MLDIKLLLVVLLGTLGMGLSFAAQADMKWIEIPRRSSPACPSVCQNSDDYNICCAGWYPQTNWENILGLCHHIWVPDGE